MPTNLELDDALVAEAKKLGKHKTSREAVNEALRKYVARHKQPRILNVFGKMDWEPSYDYKDKRRRRG
jgi:Arc/MetJ family transcription regulator